MKLAEFLKNQGLTPTEWARRNGLSQPVISRYLNGKRGLSLKTALQIQEITEGQVTVHELANGNQS